MRDTTAVNPRRRLIFAGVGLLLILSAAIALGELVGWPFLAAPLQNMLSTTLDRKVEFLVDDDAKAPPEKGFRVRFLGGVRLYAPSLKIAAPIWSEAPHMVIARAIDLEMRYIDLWRAHRGEPLRIESLRSATLDGHIERIADGRASWQFGRNQAAPTADSPPLPVPSFGNLQVASGVVRYRDAVLNTDLEAHLSLSGKSATVAAPDSKGSPLAAEIGNADQVLQVNATGQYRALPVKLTLVSSGVLPFTTDEAHAVPMPITLHATVGRAEFNFKGTASDARQLSGFTGRFRLKGPSLAAAGEPVGVTLPTTSAFQMAG
ncbi:MAG: hypothetical protein ABL931_16840, partial [Usitatibacteraceae bacterium]